jgi:hypothetical protein
VKFFPSFDFPHLLKGIRNNMLNYDVKFSWRNGEEIASWVHIEQLYDLDNDDASSTNRRTREKRENEKNESEKCCASFLS